MKSKIIIKLSLASVMILGLGVVGCESKQTSQPPQQQSSGSNQLDGNDTSSSSGSAHNNTNGQGNQGSGQSSPSQGNSGSSQSGSSNQNGGSISSTGGQTNTAPTSITDTLQQVKTVLQTRVPLMISTNVPITDGKYLTAITSSETWYYNVQFYEVNQPTQINSQAASTGTAIATIEGTEYSNTVSSHDAIQGYEKIDTSQGLTVDLGHGIKGINQGATGHVYTMWNEGRWSLKLNSPSDPMYVSPNYKDSMQLAKDIVSYLDTHYLPAPQDIGVISINNWNNSMGTTIQWQYNEMTYQVTSKDPFVALQIAVSMAFQ